MGCNISMESEKSEKKSENQDRSQKNAAALTAAMEMYRVLVSTLLILFVPQDCDGHVCSYSENLDATNNKYIAGLVLNFVTMGFMVAMYGVELVRENRLITYLEVNKELPTDNESVGLALHKLDGERRESILRLDKTYQNVGYCTIGLFAANTVLSGLVIYDYYLDNQTTTTFVTNVLFMLTKLSDMYSTVNTEKNVFYSAYMRGKVQFNDVDPDKVIKVEEVLPDDAVVSTD